MVEMNTISFILNVILTFAHSMVDLFKDEFKYYKRRKPPPDLSKPIDFSSSSFNYEDICTSIHPDLRFENKEWANYGLRPPSTWEAFSLNNNEGLLVIKNPFSAIGQRYWIARCLRDFSAKPYKINLDAHDVIIDNWWDLCHGSETKDIEKLRKSLRWATLGYHHDWDTKHYNEHHKNNMPEDLSEMCKMIASCFGFEHFTPQASIVNYYHMDSTLAPHTDHSEKNLDAPLISISFGQSAIFLIGGRTKCILPTALYIHSGDIIIMSRESRLGYHAVPRIVQSSSHPWNDKVLNDSPSKISVEKLENEQTWKPFCDYVSNSRININVRQVLHYGKENLDY